LNIIFLLKGVKGKARVSVQLVEEGYEDVEKAEIALTVIEPFKIIPNIPVYILPNSGSLL
jgi:hypothetical protein